MNRFERNYERVASRLPARLAALLDHIARPSFRAPWGGPFNGQQSRMRMFEDIVRAHPFASVVETGSYRGTTTGYLRRVTAAPVFTVETNPRFYHYCRLRFRDDPGVQVCNGDSRAFLEDALRSERLPPRGLFFYLDAHWNDDLPLSEEVEIIGAGWQDSILMIDDFQVSDDPGYGFDDYGPSRRLSLACLPAARSGRFAVFWPSARSDRETGARRGCVVLATRGVSEAALSAVRGLRPAKPE